MKPKPIPVLGVPHYNRPDLTLRLLQSIDYPVETIVLIDQSATPENVLDNERFADDFGGGAVVIIMHPNAGVAGAWNEIITLFPAPWWLIVNNDIAFAPGDLQKMAEAVDAFPAAGMLYGNHGASWFGITAAAVEQAGLFDINIFPAYLEDCDMARRFDLLGLHRANVPDVHAVHGDENMTGSSTIMSDAELRAKNGRTHAKNFDYYRAKWGDINGREFYTNPFNDPQIPVWAWRFMPGFRATQQW